MNIEIHTDYQQKKSEILAFINTFEISGKPLVEGKRNSIKLFQLGSKTVNIKSFKVPNVVNKIAYSFFRKSKAERSYVYAQKLIQKGIGTPNPIAYCEFFSFFFFKKSYYVSEQVTCDLTFRELSHNLQYPDHEKILQAFTRFTYKLHENDIHFLDHSPGNTLIKKVGEEYKFYLVDLNRMRFEKLDYETRIKNFAKLTTQKSMVKTMSAEYAKIIGKNSDSVFNFMWQETQNFQEKHLRKQRIKKRLKFWK